MASAVAPFAKWLASTDLSHTIQTTGFVIPTLQTIHILSIAVVFAAAILVDLRIWRVFDSELPLRLVARRFLPLIWPVLLILLVTGAFLIIGEPRRSLENTTFYIKMTLLALAIILTLGLQWSLSVNPLFWDENQGRRVAGRVAATASMLIWCGIIFAGRWIAYTGVS